jgi:glycosyltransferase involved in cell wall biosynthesis
MKVVVISEARLCRLPDGTVWGQSAPYSFWSRYLDGFDGVTIVAREDKRAVPPSGAVRADGPGVEVRGLPYYLGTAEYLKAWPRVRRAVRATIDTRDALILRLGSVLALSATSALLRSGKPYGVEVVGDPWQTFQPGVVDVPFRTLTRYVLTRNQQRLCAHAAVAAYVTERVLQARYPCSGVELAVSDVELVNGERATTHYSSVELRPADLANEPRRFDSSGPVRIVTVGSLAQRYKGVDVLITAVASLVRQGVSCTLRVVGDGRHRQELEELARVLGVPATFVGHLPSDKVREEMDAATLFVLASKTEGLPRAVIEAMARGLPCVATNVGGIPELLDPAVLVPPGSVTHLADKIRALAVGEIDPDNQSRRNLSRAADFRREILSKRRAKFYGHLRDRTERWLREGA